jgi:hypothetical protein
VLARRAHIRWLADVGSSPASATFKKPATAGFLFQGNKKGVRANEEKNSMLISELESYLNKTYINGKQSIDQQEISNDKLNDTADWWFNLRMVFYVLGLLSMLLYGLCSQR